MPSGYETGSGKSVSEIGNELIEKFANQFGRLLYREGLGIMSASQPLVPVDTGTLRSSGYVAEPAREGDTIAVELGYGGPAARINPKTGESADGYALVVHEDLEAHHPVGMAKFLEIPFNIAKADMPARLAEGMTEHFVDLEE